MTRWDRWHTAESAALEGRHLALLHDCIEVDVKAADVPDVSLDHQAGGVLPVQVRRCNAIEEFVAQSTVGVE